MNHMPVPRIATPLLGFVALSILLSGCAATPGETSREEQSGVHGIVPDAAQVTAAVESRLQDAGVPGAAILINDGDGHESLTLIGEAAPGQEVAAETRFAYRSMTKSFVGTVILQLAEEDRVDLDAPIDTYIDGVPDGDRITVRELGDMRSGLVNYSATPGMGELLSPDPAREPDVDQLLELSFSEPANFAPGEAYEYSNTNTLLLGEIIASVTGDPWETVVDQRILRPLGLTSVTYGFTGGDTDASGFQLADGAVVEELPVVAPGWFGAAGALDGTVQDLAEWGRALGSGALLDEQTHADRLEQFGPVTDDPNSPEYDRYGFAMGEIDGWIGHTGNGLGFQSLVMYDDETDRVAAILINGTGEDPDLPAGLFADLQEVLGN